MAYVPYIIMAVGAVLAGTACAITGIQSTQATDSGVKSQLLAASALIGFGIILLVITFFLFRAYRKSRKGGKGGMGGGMPSFPGSGNNSNVDANGKKKKNTKRTVLGAMTIIFLILTILSIGIGAALSWLAGDSAYASDQGVANALKAATVLAAVGAIVIVVGLFIAFRGK